MPDALIQLDLSGEMVASRRKHSTSTWDILNVFARCRLSRHFWQDFLFLKKFSRDFSHLQLEQNRKSPFLHVSPRSFVSAFCRALRVRARSALFCKQLEHVFRLGLRFASSLKRLHVEQKNIRECDRSLTYDNNAHQSKRLATCYTHAYLVDFSRRAVHCVIYESVFHYGRLKLIFGKIL